MTVKIKPGDLVKLLPWGGDKVIYEPSLIGSYQTVMTCDGVSVFFEIYQDKDEKSCYWPVTRVELADEKKRDAADAVNHPKHYTFGKIEVIEAIEDWKLGFQLGNAIKYIARADHKGNKLEDLKKARWYLDREIQNLEKGESNEAR